jgi:hypothetical protein
MARLMILLQEERVLRDDWTLLECVLRLLHTITVPVPVASPEFVSLSIIQSLLTIRTHDLTELQWLRHDERQSDDEQP